MSKKSDQLKERERVINKIKDAIEQIFDAFPNDEIEKLPPLYKYSKAHYQILEQAYKFHNEKQYDKAFPLFLELAEHGSEIGAEYAATYYMEGLGVRKSQKNAFLMYRKGKDNGSVISEFQLGLCYFYGRGTKKDETKGLGIIEESAFMGYIQAIWFLIDLFSKGSDTIAVDSDVADFWMQKIDYEVGEA